MEYDELKPCPFCGSTKLKIDRYTKKKRITFSVRCNSCHARGGTSSCEKTTSESIRYDICANGDPIDEMLCILKAIEKWNKRTNV